MDKSFYYNQTMIQDAWMPDYGEKEENRSDELIANPVSCDLKDIVLYYQTQPELLKLILMSKVEEDKRRTEEAKLKAKELDLVLQQDFTYQNNLMFNQYEDRRPSVMDILMDDSDCNRRDSALGSSFDGSSNSNDELDDNSHSMLSVGFPPVANTFSFGQDQHITPQPKSSNCLPLRPRKRREMQAISKIVETRDNPYNDGYFWKNNGNTIQKKTGNKSVYYKCSNSSKGCPVNKTVTAKENFEFLIKYRGHHLSDCGKVQRIVDY